MAGQLPWGGVSTFTAWLGTPSLPTSLPAPTQPFSFVGGVGHKKTMSALVNTLAWDFFFIPTHAFGVTSEKALPSPLIREIYFCFLLGDFSF